MNIFLAIYLFIGYTIGICAIEHEITKYNYTGKCAFPDKISGLKSFLFCLLLWPYLIFLLIKRN